MFTMLQELEVHLNSILDEIRSGKQIRILIIIEI